ncbi:hypothetical protein I302_106195 [Kwoniella bestiolae CBS 10118]|uniref:Uncharacterized protein n=1 Tax=Kwoniella bestiolae CBS 10118 TaxID=1296100 RepID=A0A1B9G3D3_9TREE|nr:hypothetical protein I302_05318 [Kwoniella bestiolae CBS 10118]OCF25498.1 hypothetical protein I302_05318 [Kwoniella bestiolae CBS 10118]
MKLPRFFAIFLAFFLLFISLAAAIPTQTTDDDRAIDVDSAMTMEDMETAGTVDEQQQQIEMLDNLSNAQRMARGLPLRKPGHLFNSRLGARAPAPSQARRDLWL